MKYKKRSAWGITNTEPLTGVFQINSCEWLYEDRDKGINLTFENHCRLCKEEYHDNCFEFQPDDTWLIGFKLNQAMDKYEPDLNAEYSAIVGGTYVQVVRSKWGVKGNHCSPCYPCQVDPDSDGDWIGYSIPPDVVGELNEKLKAKIFELE